MKIQIQKLVLLSIFLIFLGINGLGQGSLPSLPNKTIQAWIYPGSPGCNVSTEYSDGRIIEVLKPQYLRLDTNGIVIQKTESINGCYGYTAGNALEVKNHSTYQFLLVTDSDKNLDKLVSHANDLNYQNWVYPNFINPIISLVNSTGYTGVDLDLENPSDGWSNSWSKYKLLIDTLGKVLHNSNKLLNITIPTWLSNTDQVFFKDNNIVDFVTVMCYDVQYSYIHATSPIDTNFGPVAPNTYTKNAISKLISNMVTNSINPTKNLNKIIVGMPSYGYHVNCKNSSCDSIVLKGDAKIQTMNIAGYNTAIRDTSSYEMRFQKGNNVDNTWYYYQDAVGMSMKEEFIRSQGIKHVTVWSLGGNDWFNKFEDTSFRQVTAVLDSTYWNNASGALNYSIIHDTTCAYPTSLSTNQIIFKGTNDYSNSLFKGMEVALIGHAENDTNQYSKISVEFSSDGNSWTTSDSVTDGVKIYSNHDVIKIIGDSTDKWHLTTSPFATYQIRIKYKSGAVPHINGVFVKMYFGSSVQQGLQTLIDTINNAKDDAVNAITSTSNEYENDSIGSVIPYTHHRFGTYKGASYINGFRYNNITIPKGCIIDSAFLDLYFRRSRTHFKNSSFNYVFHGENNSNPSTFDTINNPINTPYYRFYKNNNLISDSSVYTFDSTQWSPTTQLDGYGVKLINITNVIQGIIDQSSWSSGNSLVILAKSPTVTTDSNYVCYLTYEDAYSSAHATRLYVYYHTNESSLCEYYNTPKHITSDTTWDADPVIVLNDVIVDPGVTLTITGAVEFTQQAKLIVQQGGVVIIDGGLLTNLCDNKTWQGIEVWGTSGKGQNSILNSPFQGMVQLINGAEIDNAEDAIRLWHPNDTATTGGIVIANNATFYNNRRSIDFEKYQNIIPGPTDTSNIGNLSQFVNCTFDIDDDYISANKFYCHASLWNVNGIFFQGCTFMNEQSDIQYSASNNKGIISLDAGYTINGYCDHSVLYGQSCPKELLTPCYFSGFNYAVHAMTSSTPNVVVVDESVFDQNVIGVEYDAVNNSWVNRSEFKVGNSNIANVTPGIYHTGIVTIGSTGYRIEEDTLQPSSSPVSNTIGIRINNSNTGYNQVYKNTSTGLVVAEQAEGLNKNPTYNYKGLQILCNTHNQNTNAIKIYHTSSPSDGIGVFQGDPNSSTSAGNIFSQNDSDIVNNSQSLIKYYYTEGLAQPQYCTPTLVDTIHVNNANTCPSNFDNGYSFPLSIESAQTIATNYGLLKSAYLNLLYNYNSMIDGGDENLILENLESTWSNDAWKMRADLLKASPYLSLDALKQVAISGILPQAMLLEVCLANPEGTRDENFIYLLGNVIPNPLPQYMLDLIVERWHTETVRTLLEANLADVSSKMTVISNLLISNSMLDTIQHKENALNLFLQRGDLSDYYSLTENYIESSDYENVYTYFNQIPTLFNLTKEQQTEYNNYKEYISFRKQLVEKRKNIMQLADDEINSLKEIADNKTGRSSVLAQNILCFCYQMCVDYIPADDNVEHYKASKPKIPAKQIIQSAYNKIIATPNPASVYVAFTWILPILKGNAQLLITDVNGKTIAQHTITTKAGQWIWDTRAVKKSIYLYDVKSDNERLGNGKVVINN